MMVVELQRRWHDFVVVVREQFKQVLEFGSGLGYRGQF